MRFGGTEMVQDLGNVLLVISALEALAFVVAYHLMTSGAWTRSPAGRHVMSFMAVLTVVLSLAVLRIFIPESPVFQTLRTLAYAGIPVVFAWRLRLLWQAQHDRDNGCPDPRHRATHGLAPLHAGGMGHERFDQTGDERLDAVTGAGMVLPADAPAERLARDDEDEPAEDEPAAEQDTPEET